MCRARGLTLIEVLLATVLMATLAATCASLVQSVPGDGQTRGVDRSVDRVDLATMADAVLADPQKYGIASWESVAGIRTINAATASGRTVQLEVQVIASTSQMEKSTVVTRVKSNWIAFTCHDMVVLRWVPCTEAGDQ